MGDKKAVDALVDGEKATAGPPLGPVLGPLGVNVLQIVNKINELTKAYAGMKVPVKIAQMKRTNSYARTLKSAVKEVAGACVSMGVTIGAKDPKDFVKELDSGVYDNVLKEAE